MVGIVITTVVALANFPILARGLGVSNRGSLALILAVSEIGTNLFRFGIPEAVALLDKERVASGRAIYRSARRLSVSLLFLSIPIAVLLYHTLLDPLPRQEKALAAVLVGWSPVFDTLGIARARFLSSRSDAVGMALASVIPSVVSLLGFSMLLLLGELSVTTAVLVTVFASAASYSVSFIRIRFSATDDSPPSGALFSLAWRGAPYSAMEAANLRLDQAVIPTLVGPTVLGKYAVANSLANPLTRLGTVLAGGFYADIQLTSPDDGRGAAGKALRRSAALVLISATIAMALAPFTLPVLAGPGYSDALPMALLLLPASASLVIAIVLANLLGALGRPALASWSQAGGLCVTVSLIVPAVLWRGGIGAAAVSLLSYSTRAALGYYFIRRLGVTKVCPRRSDFRWALKLPTGRSHGP